MSCKFIGCNDPSYTGSNYCCKGHADLAIAMIYFKSGYAAGSHRTENLTDDQIGQLFLDTLRSI